MIRILNFLGISAIVYSIFTGTILFNNLPKDTNPIVRKMEIKEHKKIKTPPESPKLMDQKLLAKYEMIDSLEYALTEHIINVLNVSKYGCMGKNRVEYAQELSSALLKYTKGDIDLLLWITSMAKVESSYRLNADPRVSSARGYLQVIYRYHEKELKTLGVSKEDISTDPYKSILAGVAVFQKYLKIEHGNFEKATRRYRGLSVSEKQQRAYLNAIKEEERKIKIIIEQYA